jgi:predicted SPOUT superfamily RNA methylase MTH1
MYIAELFHGGPEQPTEKQAETVVEANQTQLVVLYPGRFQPFHLGHADVFRTLQAKFGRDNVFIATSNKADGGKSPFNFTDKVTIMHAAGVPSDRILEVQSPYKLPAQFDATTTVLVVTVGAPDAERLQVDGVKKDGNPGYYKTFKSLDECVTADKHGYVVIASERQKVITLNGQQVDVSHGTPSRAAWNSVRKDPKGRAEYMNQMFGRADQELGLVLDKIPESVTESYSRKDFNKKIFETVFDYTRFLMSKKLGNDQIHKCRTWPTKLVVNESSQNQTVWSDAKNLAALMRKLDQSDKVEIKVGNQVALLHTMIMAATKGIDLYGYTTPKTISEVHLSDNGKIDFIVFDDGKQYPESGEEVHIGAKQIINTAMFPDKSSVEQAHTQLWFALSKLEGAGWKVHTNLEESPTESITMKRKEVTQPIHPEEMDRLVTSVGQKAKQGPMKTVWNPLTRKYKVVPAAQASLEEDDVAPMSREEYNSRRKALQQIQMDPHLTRDPTLRKELIKKIAQLTMQARSAGVLPESVHAAHVQENKMYTARAIVETIKYLKESFPVAAATGVMTRSLAGNKNKPTPYITQSKSVASPEFAAKMQARRDATVGKKKQK